MLRHEDVHTNTRSTLTKKKQKKIPQKISKFCTPCNNFACPAPFSSHDKSAFPAPLSSCDKFARPAPRRTSDGVMSLLFQ